MEARSGDLACQGHAAAKWQRQDVSWEPGPRSALGDRPPVWPPAGCCHLYDDVSLIVVTVNILYTWQDMRGKSKGYLGGRTWFPGQAQGRADGSSMTQTLGALLTLSGPRLGRG